MKIRRRTGGFTLPSTLVGFALSMVTLAMSVPIFHWCTIGLHSGQTAAASAASFDSGLNLLRRDIWQAQSMQEPSPNQLVLTSPAGQTVWQFSADGTVVRRPAAGGGQRWHPGLGHIRVAQTGAVVTVTIPASPGQAGYTLGMIGPTFSGQERHP